MVLVFVVQHGEKERLPGDPGLTARGVRQAVLAAERLRGAGVAAVYSSPLRRARDTAAPLAAALGLGVRLDGRLRERMNWDGSVPLAVFLRDWEAATADRGFVPVVGDSSAAAAGRFLSFLSELEGPGPVAVFSHGGVTVDVLRSLLGDAAVPAPLLREGVPGGAVTVLDGLEVVEVASVGHLDR